jgi:hypothetical protein
MKQREAWTISIVLRSDAEQTSADAFLVGPPVEVEGTGYVLTRMLAPDDADVMSIGQNVAAARALQMLSQRLYNRACACRAKQSADLPPT